jgi:hypothetical protein
METLAKCDNCGQMARKPSEPIRIGGWYAGMHYVWGNGRLVQDGCTHCKKWWSEPLDSTTAEELAE